MWCNDLETSVSIDADEVLDYVKDNREWFLRELGACDDNGQVLQIKREIENLLNNYDSIRRDRDYNRADNDAVRLYEDLTKLKNNITIN